MWNVFRNIVMTCLKATSDEFKMAAIQLCCAVEKKSRTSERGGTTLWYWSLLRQPYTVALEYTYTHTVAATADSGGCLKNEMISLAWNMNERKFLRIRKAFTPNSSQSASNTCGTCENGKNRLPSWIHLLFIHFACSYIHRNDFFTFWLNVVFILLYAILQPLISQI